MHALILAFLLVSPQQDVLRIESGSQTYVGDLVTVSGDAVITYGDLRVEAELVLYNEVTGDMEADGDVIFVRGAENLTGRNLRFNLETMTGSMRDVAGELGPGFIIEASELTRLADDKYELIDATVTTCDETGHKGWAFHTPRVVIDPDSNVEAWNSVLRIRGIPIFYMPYLRAPAESRPRSSGLLTPQTSTSTTKGRSLSQSYYHVINRSADVTVTAEYFTLRGMAGAVDFRAVPNENSRVEINTFFARDKKNQGGQSTRILSFTERGKLRAVADLNIVSSFLFRQVFEEGFNLISSPIEHSQAFVTYNTPGVSYNFNYSRRGTFFVDQPTTIIRKSPSLEMSVSSFPLADLPVYFSFEGSVAGLHRRDAVLDSPSLMQRVDFHPTIEVPLVRGRAINWSHRIGFRETLYSHSELPQIQRKPLNRLSFEYGFELTGPTLEREFGPWRHVVEPHVEYRYVSGVNRFLDTLLIDDIDLVTNTNEVRYGITNRIFTDREILSWTVSQKYFANPTFGGALVGGRDNVFEPLLDLTGFGFADEARRFSPLVSVLSFSPRPGSNTDLQIDYDTIRKQFRSAGIIGGHREGPAFVNLAYFFTRRSPIQTPSNQIRATIGYGDSAAIGLNGAFSFAYNVDQAFFQASTAQVSYNTDCYGLHAEFMQFDLGPRRESRIRFSFSLKHIGWIGTLRRQDRLF